MAFAIDTRIDIKHLLRKDDIFLDISSFLSNFAFKLILNINISIIMNTEEHHHHHHHHEHLDSASIFKRKSLNSIKRRKLISKWLFVSMFCIAVILIILCIIAYRIQ
jgi:hypothetical protein